jgi:sulfhydrogenase subunit beta (sulfur reductase)
VIGPQVRSGSIVYGELGSVDDLPAGIEDVQEGGTYGLRERDDSALFALFPPVLAVWRARRAE